MPDPSPHYTRGEPLVDADHPWLGLLPFREAHRRFFFGRDREIADLFECVRRRPLTVLFGRSGLGKTSLLTAGLCPRLRDEGWLPVLIRLRYPCRDGEPAPLPPPALLDQIGAEIARTLQTAGHTVPGALLDPGLAGLWRIFHDTAAGLCGPAAPRLVLLLDQFEEVFTLGEDEARAPDDVERLRDALADLVENRPPPALARHIELEPGAAAGFDFDPTECHVAIIVREDYLARLERWRRTLPSVMRNRMELRSLDGPRALHAVVHPARLDGRDLVSDEVAAAIVRGVANAGDEVPLDEIADVRPELLSLLCARLNERRIGPRIEANLLAASCEDILETYYTNCFVGLPDSTRETIEDLLLSPITGCRESLSADTVRAELTRRGVADPSAAINALQDARLLTAEDRGGIRRLELTHDVLAKLVKRLRKERQERERTEHAHRETVAQHRRLVWWAFLVALFAVLGTVTLTQAISARQGRRFSQAKRLTKQATTDLNEGYARFSEAREDIDRAAGLVGDLNTNLTAKREALSALKSQSIKLGDHLNGRRVEADSLAGKMELMEQQATKLSASWQDLKRRQPEVKKKLQDAEATLGTMDTNLRERYSEVVSNLLIAIAEASKTLDKSAPDLAKLGGTISELVDRQRLVKGQLISARSVVTNTWNSLAGATNQFAKLDEALPGFTNLIDQAEAQVEAGREAVQTAERGLNKVNEAVSETTARMLDAVRVKRPEDPFRSYAWPRDVLIEHYSNPLFRPISVIAPTTYSIGRDFKKLLQFPAEIEKAVSAVTSSDEFDKDLSHLGFFETLVFRDDLEEAMETIASFRETARAVETDAVDLRNQAERLAGDFQALRVAAASDLAEIKGIVRDAGNLCTQVSTNVLRARQAEDRLRQLIP